MSTDKQQLDQVCRALIATSIKWGDDDYGRDSILSIQPWINAEVDVREQYYIRQIESAIGSY